MEVLTPNNVKIYNLSAGKTLPEWLTERKRRTLQKSDVGVRKRIELIQDFTMPDLSTGIKLTKDGQYILATGTYKPRVRCFEVANLSLKFERCFDAEAVQFLIVTDDYEKMFFLQEDRYVEMHTRAGKYYRFRIPRFGRDLAYSHQNCDMYFVGAGPHIYRVNMEQGRFLPEYTTEARSINKIKMNTDCNFIVVGTNEGKVGLWDIRLDREVASLDVALNCFEGETGITSVPSITALNFKNGLTMAVGTSIGQVHLYDIRSNKPYTVKDHQYELPVKNIGFIDSEDMVVSSDSRCVRFWNHNTGKHYTGFESDSILNEMCLVPNTGMLFLANDSEKLFTYYIPSLGPAPRWCHFLDQITEELEESTKNTVYDDYRFVTEKEVEDLGLEHLKGTGYLEGYMHGYQMDIRLYHKAKEIVQPFAYKEFKKKKIKEIIESEMEKRIKTKKLPSVNKDLALKLTQLVEMQKEGIKTKGKKNEMDAQAFLEDDRFKAIFEDPAFEIDPTHEEYGSILPLMEKEISKYPSSADIPYAEMQDMEDEEHRRVESSSSSKDSDSDQNSDEDTDEDAMEMRKSPINKNKDWKGAQAKPISHGKTKQKLYAMKASAMGKKGKELENNASLTLEERMQIEQPSFKQPESSHGNTTFTFQPSDSQKKKKGSTTPVGVKRRLAPHPRKRY